MAAKQSERIKLWGIVQGVGFRPYVAKTAARLNMKGQVLNIGGLVEIIVTDTPLRISSFITELINNKPAPAEIVHIKREPAEYQHFDSFTIIKSYSGDNEAAMIPADLAICPECLAELYDKNNPRYQHPFISCMICGPRFTIIDKFPYDRENTAMMDFPMCRYCEEEYTSLNDRRYHAQTISCHDCGPQLLWKSNISDSTSVDKGSSCKGHIHTDRSLCDNTFSISENPNGKHDTVILNNAADILKNGGVLAFKTIGGYNLVADPLNETAVAKLRNIKKRESKPFAVMFRDISQIETFCHINNAEKQLLKSSARPIILLEHKVLPYEEINKSRFIGSFLPGFAAQYMLLDRISPLIFTSANLSDMPMIKDESEMKDMMKKNPEIAGMIYNERDIRVRADDSVARIIDGQPQMIRRSKGYAPVPLYIDISREKPSSNENYPNTSSKNNTIPTTSSMILATGSQLKNSFALTKGSFTYISQYFGDMDTVENQNLYSKNVTSLKSLFRIKPTAVACDMHPLYFTTKFAQKYAVENDLPLIKIQHHHAHVASVMAENDIKGSVIGVSFDGTGYGTDGNIWGGEFFLCKGGDAQRIAHLKYVNMIGGDSSVKDAKRSALSYIYAFENGYLNASKQERFSELIKNRSLDCISSDYDDAVSRNISSGYDCREIPIDISDIIRFGKKRLLALPESKLVLTALNSGINTVKSSSMGRLFDGVSALLGIKDHNDYEGQCAIMLEDAAAFAQKHPGDSKAFDLALSFHNRIIDMVVDQCLKIRKNYGVSQVALTGGTFQNKILMEGILEKLRNHGFTPYYNISVSPNDGGIALGQAYVAMHRLLTL